MWSSLAEQIRNWLRNLVGWLAMSRNCWLMWTLYWMMFMRMNSLVLLMVSLMDILPVVRRKCWHWQRLRLSEDGWWQGDRFLRRVQWLMIDWAFWSV